MILIDNYDSFTYNLVQYLRELGIEPIVFKNDKISIRELREMNFSSVLISPGPSNPDNAGICMEVINEFKASKKILGICLGHQCIAQYFGAKIIKLSNPTHGKVSKIFYNENEKLFEGIPQRFLATRYHSLTVDSSEIPPEVEVVATTEDKIIMALKHKLYKIYGVQFHPEAILTEYGKVLLQNFFFNVA